MKNHSEKIKESKKDFDRNCSISGKKSSKLKSFMLIFYAYVLSLFYA